MKKYIITGLLTIVLIAGITSLFKEDGALNFETNEQYFIAIVETAISEQYDDVSIGYEPNIITNVFKGVVNEDFEGVATDFGKYEVINGGIAFRPNEGEAFGEGKLYISVSGMKTLLENIATRLNIELTDEASVEEVIKNIYQVN